MAEAFPMKYIDSQSICEVLIQFSSRVGLPIYVLSANGQQFVSEIMAQVSKLLGIKQDLCSLNHAMSNGICERTNGILTQLNVMS